MTRYSGVSLLGIVFLLGFAWLFSTSRRQMNWRLIIGGIGLQMVFSILVFRLSVGTKLLQLAGLIAVKVMDCSRAGTEFVFGRLAQGPAEPDSLGFILSTQALPTIIFFSALMAILYYYGIMQLVIRGFAWVFTRLLRISGAESLCAASNIFVGVESTLTIRPYIQKMTQSELCTVLTTGMATVASTVLGVYVLYLQPRFPNIAGHLISASFLSAPAALVASKILMPETGKPETLGLHVNPHYERESSVFEAVMNGAATGLRLLLGIVALLIAVQGLAALADLILQGVGGRVNIQLGWHVDWSLTGLLGYFFHPFALAMGVPFEDAGLVGRLLGERAILTEIPAYGSLAAAIESGAIHDPRSAVIASYALCGFAHIASVGIFVGAMAALVPERTRDLARVGFRALAAATIACLLTGCMAGIFYIPGTLILDL